MRYGLPALVIGAVWSLQHDEDIGQHEQHMGQQQAGPSARPTQTAGADDTAPAPSSSEGRQSTSVAAASTKPSRFVDLGFEPDEAGHKGGDTGEHRQHQGVQQGGGMEQELSPRP